MNGRQGGTEVVIIDGLVEVSLMLSDLNDKIHLQLLR
jgi:hypothetical protein